MGIDVELVLNDRGVFRMDAPKIQRAIHNLARNAAEAIGKDGGRLQIAVDRRDDGSLVLTVSDDGPGIPDEIRARLFAPFATHGKVGGTGLGLAVVRTIIEEHGGSVTVESEPGNTVFTLVLPESTAGPREVTPSTPSERGEATVGE
jgi:signal transduction histidine kinase